LNNSHLLRGVDTESLLTKSVLGNSSLTETTKIDNVLFVKTMDKDHRYYEGTGLF